MPVEPWKAQVRAAMRQRGWRKLAGAERFRRELGEDASIEVGLRESTSRFDPDERRFALSAALVRSDVAALVEAWSASDHFTRGGAVALLSPPELVGVSAAEAVGCFVTFAESDALRWARAADDLDALVDGSPGDPDDPYGWGGALTPEQRAVILHLLGRADEGLQVARDAWGYAEANMTETFVDRGRRFATAMAGATGQVVGVPTPTGRKRSGGQPAVWFDSVHGVAEEVAGYGEPEVARRVGAVSDRDGLARVAVGIGTALHAVPTRDGGSISIRRATVLGAIWAVEGRARATRRRNFSSRLAAQFRPEGADHACPVAEDFPPELRSCDHLAVDEDSVAVWRSMGPAPRARG